MTGAATIAGVAVAVVVAVLVLGLWLVWTANRLDKLHLRCAAARATLEEQALRRAVAAQELATSGSLDIASAVLLSDAAVAARGPLAKVAGRPSPTSPAPCTWSCCPQTARR